MDSWCQRQEDLEVRSGVEETVLIEPLFVGAAQRTVLSIHHSRHACHSPHRRQERRL